MMDGEAWIAEQAGWEQYGRGYRITIETDWCSRCGEKGTCLVVDTSDHEYLSVTLCAPCLEQLTGVVRKAEVPL